jgi:hypothetical protein
MTRGHRLLWFVAFYVASVTAFACLTFLIRELFLLVQHLV